MGIKPVTSLVYRYTMCPCATTDFNNNYYIYSILSLPVDYARGESPHILESGVYTQTANPPKIALSPNAEVLAVSCDANVEFYDTYTGKLYDTVENVYTG